MCHTTKKPSCVQNVTLPKSHAVCKMTHYRQKLILCVKCHTVHKNSNTVYKMSHFTQKISIYSKCHTIVYRKLFCVQNVTLCKKIILCSKCHTVQKNHIVFKMSQKIPLKATCVQNDYF